MLWKQEDKTYVWIHLTLICTWWTWFLAVVAARKFRFQAKIFTNLCFSPNISNSIHHIPSICIACCGAKRDWEHNCTLTTLLKWIVCCKSYCPCCKNYCPCCTWPVMFALWNKNSQVASWRDFLEFLKLWDSASVKFVTGTQFYLTAVVSFPFF